MKAQRKYHAWRANSKCEPIDGTDRFLMGSNRKSIVKHLAQEEGVPYKEGDILVKCTNGDIWFVRYFVESFFSL
jgi:hypothetical protein